MSDTKLTAEESCRQVLKSIADACDQESLARAGGYLFRYVQEEIVLRESCLEKLDLMMKKLLMPTCTSEAYFT